LAALSGLLVRLLALLIRLLLTRFLLAAALLAATLAALLVLLAALILIVLVHGYLQMLLKHCLNVITQAAYFGQTMVPR